MSYLPNNIVPPKTIVPWWSTSAVPAGWTECNGALVTMEDGSSVTTPNLIGMMIQGSDITGGSSSGNASGFTPGTNQAIQGTATHTHTYSGAPSFTTGGPSAASVAGEAGLNQVHVAGGDHTHNITMSFSDTSAAGTTEPACYGVVMIMKL